MRAYERLLKYVSVYTTSDPDSATVPSSMRQYDLANILVDELKTSTLTKTASSTAGCPRRRAASRSPRSALSPISTLRRIAPAKT